MNLSKELQEAQKHLINPLWRLNNLYHIVDKNGVKQQFKLNWAQKELYEGLWYCNLVLKARQLGISTFACILFLDRCLFNSNQHAGIIACTLEDAQHLFKKVKFAYDELPASLKSHIVATNDSARELTFSNGSSLRVGTSMRGSTFQYLHISEFGKISSTSPDRAREIVTGSLNTLAAGQYVIIESTAEGREGYFFEMCKAAQALQELGKPLTKLDYRFFFFPWYKEPAYVLDQPVTLSDDLKDYFDALKIEHSINLTKEQKWWYAKKQSSQRDDMKREFPSTPEESFETAIDGSYYGRYITQARMEGRITKTYYSPDAPVHSAWDLGYGDSTAIWLFQLEGREIHLLEYIEGALEPLTYYLKVLKTKPYIYGKHLAPHDAAAHEYGSGLTRIETARRNGFHFTVVPDISVDDGIDAVRHLLNRCYFDEVKCAKGLTHLENYRRAWNQSMGCWSNHPLHNASSHGADAFRYLAVGQKFISTDGELTEAEIERLYSENNPHFAA